MSWELYEDPKKDYQGSRFLTLVALSVLVILALITIAA